MGDGFSAEEDNNFKIYKYIEFHLHFKLLVIYAQALNKYFCGN